MPTSWPHPQIKGHQRESRVFRMEERTQGRSYSYQERGVSAFDGSGVDGFRYPNTYSSPPTYAPQGSVFSSSLGQSAGSHETALTPAPPPISPPPSSRLLWVSQTLESWFGTTERFEANFIQLSRLVLVDCVTYPFIVFSHQCQLFPYNTVRATVTAPFSTLVVINNILNVQGVAALWRGWRGHTFHLVALPFIGALLTKLSEISSEPGGGFSVKYLVRMLIVKSLPHVVLLPLASYTYIDMVQTTKDSEYKEGIIQLARERPLFKQDELRRIPFLLLATPTVLHGLLSSGISHLIQRLIRRLFRSPRSPHEPNPQPLTSAVGALWMDYFSLLLTDALLYPLETIVIRLHCQGMPALVDNIQNGLEGSFVSSYYRGVVDCATGVWDSEGPLGFFKGFSSLLIRYSLHGLALVLLWRTAQMLETRLHRTAR